MAATNYTPISLYYTTTAAATPSAGNLVAGELALNTLDEKLYFKNSAGIVKLLASNAVTAPVTTITFGTTGLTPSSATSGAVTVAGTLAVANGGTGQTSYTDGQLLIGNTTGNTLSKTTLTAGSGVTITNGSGAITIAATGSGGTVTSASVVSANGFAGTVATATTTPAITLTTSITGVLKGNGTAISAATAGTDYVAPGTATTFTATQTFSGSTSTFGTSLLDSNETVNVVASAPASTTNFYVQSGSVQYYTTNAANNWTLNIAFSSGTSMNTALATGQSVTFTLVTTQTTTAYYNSAVTIDGTSVTPKWIGGAPTAGNASGLDTYRFAVIKTASATYTVLASLTQYK